MKITFIVLHEALKEDQIDDSECFLLHLKTKSKNLFAKMTKPWK
jgi:hypothetical protein